MTFILIALVGNLPQFSALLLLVVKKTIFVKGNDACFTFACVVRGVQVGLARLKLSLHVKDVVEISSCDPLTNEATSRHTGS